MRMGDFLLSNDTAGRNDRNLYCSEQLGLLGLFSPTFSLQTGSDPASTLANLQEQTIQAFLFICKKEKNHKQYYLSRDEKNNPSVQMAKRPGVALRTRNPSRLQWPSLLRASYLSSLASVITVMKDVESSMASKYSVSSSSSLFSPLEVK